MAAVRTLLAQSKNAWWMSNFPSGIQDSSMAASAARKPTTTAWACQCNTLVQLLHGVTNCVS